MPSVKIIITTDVYSDLQSYVPRARREAQYMKDQGWDVETVILQHRIIGDTPIRNTIDGIPVVHYLARTKKSDAFLKRNALVFKFKKLFYAAWYLKFAIWLRRYLKEHPCDVIHCHNISADFAGWFAKPKNTKLVFVMREIYEGQSLSWLYGFAIKHLSRFLQNRSDWLIHVVPEQMDYTTEKNKRKVMLIPNYPEQYVFMPCEKSESAHLRISYIGTVRDHTSLKMLMDAAKELADVDIFIHGMGGIYEQLKRESQNYQNVAVTGSYEYYSQSKILYQNTDILYIAYNPVRINWRRGRAIKLYEAIVTQTPIIMPNEMTVSSIIKEYDIGWTYDYRQESLAALLKHIRQNPDEIVMKKNNLAKIQFEFTWDKVVALYDDIYKKQ